MASSENVRQRHVEKKKGNESRRDRFGDLSEEEATKKASRGWIRHFLSALILTPMFCIVILFVIPSNIEPVEYTGLSPPPAFVGPLAPNNLLTNAERIFNKKLNGPESIVVDGDHIYTGTADGWVNHLYKGEVHRLVRFGKEPCGGYDNENTCGRPLGMRMDKNGFLIVCDAYHGLFKVNVATGDYVTLYPATDPVNGETSKFLNDLDIGPDGKIYFSDSSTQWHRNQFHNIFMEGRANGRLLMYNPENGITEQLLGDLLFANGVQITPDKLSILVVECGRSRVMKYDLKSKQVSIWAENLPGLPDNIRYHQLTGTYWIGIALVRKADQFSFFDYAAARPWLRGMVAKMLSLESFLTIKKAFDKSDVRSIAVELNSSGNIISTMQDKDGSVIEAVSEVESSDQALYFGSYSGNYLGRMYRKKIPK